MSAEAVLRSVHFSTVATVMAGSTTAMLVLEVPLVVPHVLHCHATLETLDPPINVNHSEACSGVKFKDGGEQFRRTQPGWIPFRGPSSPDFYAFWFPLI